MTDIEIPYKQDRDWRYRFFEILPGAISWSMLALPIILSLVNPTAAAFFIIGYLLVQFTRGIAVSVQALRSHKKVTRFQKYNWWQLAKELEAGELAAHHGKREKWHLHNLKMLQEQARPVKPSEVLHVAIIATYNESREVLEPTVKSVLASNYDKKKIMLVVAYEERGGSKIKQVVHDLLAEYGSEFYDTMAVEHPADIPGEIIGKGGNITYAARDLEKYLAKKKINPQHVVVTTLDADNRPHREYFGALTYTYAMCLDPKHISFQPVSVYNNNIWDAPAPMRVLATGNTYWNTMLASRPHLLRNFSAHAQSMEALIETDYWSVRTIVEDGHQFWRSYFRFDGKHQVFPIYIPIYQDAVLAETYRKTLKAQFVQLRRWTYGASDIAYVASKGFLTKNKVPRPDLWFKFGRLLEGHITWAIAPMLLTLAAFVPVLFNPENYAANQLPVVVSYVQRIALVGILASIYICFKTLPPRPARYRRHRTVFMVIQWVYMPLTSLLYGSVAALYSQTRLILGKYMDKFDVTVKAVVTDDERGRVS